LAGLNFGEQVSEHQFRERREIDVLVFLSFLSQRGEGCMEDFIGHQFWRQQPLENQAFDQGVYDADELVGGHGEIFFFRDRAKPFLAEHITLGGELGNFCAQSFLCECIGQAR
jgi:hypothetical protein